MEFILLIATKIPNIQLPETWLNWLGLFLCLIIMVWGIVGLIIPIKKKTQKKNLLLGLLILLSILSNLSLIIQVQWAGETLSGGVNFSENSTTIILLSAVPWALAAIWVGPVEAIFLALISGLTRAAFDTHSLYTIIVYGLISLVFSWAVSQPYRPTVFSFLRRPVGAFLLSMFLGIPIIMGVLFFDNSGSLFFRLDYSITQSNKLISSTVIELLIASVLLETSRLFYKSAGRKNRILIPAPFEKSLTSKFYFLEGPFIWIIIYMMVVGGWLIARNEAYLLTRQQMANVLQGNLPVDDHTDRVQTIEKDGYRVVILPGLDKIPAEWGNSSNHVAKQLVQIKQLGKSPKSMELFISDTSLKNYAPNLYLYREIEKTNHSMLVYTPVEETLKKTFVFILPYYLFFSLLIVLFLFGWQWIIGLTVASLKKLTLNTMFISQGQMDNSLKILGNDEIGQLSNHLETMRLNLKARLDDLNHLLNVSQEASSHLINQESIMPVLESAVRNGGAFARIVLNKDVVLNPPDSKLVAFGIGRSSETLAYMDEQIFDLMAKQDVMAVPSTNRNRRLNFIAGQPIPGAIIGLALRHDEQYFGALWVAYSKPRNFPDVEIKYLTALATRLAMAASNSKYFSTSEIGRQRFEAVLASSPEPVMVFDENQKLILINQAALKIPHLVLSSETGSPIQEALSNTELIAMISNPVNEGILTREVSLADGHFYLVSVSPVTADQQPVGKVCLIQDISHYKELDHIKTDFVQMVSHNLRQPISLVKSNLSMLEMVGTINESQKQYVDHIGEEVEKMSKLVNNLLSLNRMESGMGLQIEKVEGPQLLKNVVQNLTPAANQKGIKMEIIPSKGESFEIECDRAMVEEALYNLAENAVKFSPLNGNIKLKTLYKPDVLVFEIMDNGVGIAPLDQQKLFNNASHNKQVDINLPKGNGLGLTIVKSVAEKHHGAVWVESQLGKGSSFFLSIPYQQPKNGDMDG